MAAPNPRSWRRTPWQAAAAILLCCAMIGRAAVADEKRFVIVDNDWVGATALLPLLAAPQIELLGVTVVTGDGWRDQAYHDVRRFMAQVGLRRVPVVPGAVYPLVNTLERMLAWEQAHGRIPWKGAWNGPEMGPAFHPRDPALVVPPVTDTERLSADAETAAAFLVRQVRARPHQITIFAAGPLTNLALAQRLDPAFASLAKELVFIGGNLAQLKRNGSVKSDFNFIFDPEAAEIVLAAPWARIVSVGDVADDALLSSETLRQIAESPGVMARYARAHLSEKVPLWDELGAAIVADPAIVTAVVSVRMAVDTGTGVHRGRARVWTLPNAPAQAGPVVTIVREIDLPRFMQRFVESTRAALPQSPP